MNWIINEYIEPFNFSTELFDVFPVVEQHFYGINNSLHGVEAVWHCLWCLLDVTDAQSRGWNTLELYTLNITIWKSFESNRVNGHALDAEPLSRWLANFSVFSKPFWVNFSSEWVTEANKTLSIGQFHSVFNFTDSLLSIGRSVSFVELRQSCEFSTSILKAKLNQSMLQLTKRVFSFLFF